MLTVVMLTVVMLTVVILSVMRHVNPPYQWGSITH
jgi:hypothetical protein